jgi:hypothetical protein
VEEYFNDARSHERQKKNKYVALVTIVHNQVYIKQKLNRTKYK